MSLILTDLEGGLALLYMTRSPGKRGVKDPVVYLLLDCYVHFNVLYYIELIDLLMVGTPENVVSMGILLLVVYNTNNNK